MEYQDINVLSSYRKNQFCADGKSKDYFLDTEGIDEVKSVWVDDVLVTNYTVSKELGKISFSVAPNAPSMDGQDNIIVLFKKEVKEYTDRVCKCRVSLAFDNRAFFSGNVSYPNAIFHSEANNAAYISDLSYYQDGSSDNAIRDMCVGNDILWVFKGDSQNGGTIFYHVPTTDGSLGRIYPSKQGNVNTGCFSKCTNFNDDIVFLSRGGLEGITGDIKGEQLLSHRSSMVDNKLINENNYRDSQLVEWQGYLLVLVDDCVFLADSRQKFQGINGVEYEWYYWRIKSAKPNILKEFNGDLYIGSTDGNIFVFEGTNDNGVSIESYWTTPMDSFGYPNMLKITNKRGGVAKIKIIPNGVIKIAERTNKRDERDITSKSLNGFTYNDFSYTNFSYVTKNDTHIVYKIKEKKFIEISLKFYSDELDKPFGVYGATLEAFVGGYVKR